VPEGFLDPSKVPKAAQPILAPIDDDVEMKVEEQEHKPAGEPSLEPAEGAKGTDASEVPATQPVDT
jgi:hypothetical protein